jgi:hypothetical protein
MCVCVCVLRYRYPGANRSVSENEGKGVVDDPAWTGERVLQGFTPPETGRRGFGEQNTK